MRVAVSIVVLSLLITINISNAQNITNTLGASGVFKVKDGSNDYLSLDQTTGNTTFYRNLELGGNTNSTSTVGVITKNGQRFIHNYQATGTDGANTFIGLYSGNFTMGGFFFNGSYNTSVGFESLHSLTTGSHNSAFGFKSLFSNTIGQRNTAMGFESLRLNALGDDNSAFGFQALNENTNTNGNSAFGAYSLASNKGFWNSAFGSSSLASNFNGIENSAFGYRSMWFNTNGSQNSSFGMATLYSNIDGGSNSAFGSYSLYTNTGGNNNSAFGFQSLYSNSASNNSAFGYKSLYFNQSGRQNTAVGYKSLYLNVSGFQNTAVGDSALYKNTGNYNTALGYAAGSDVTTGANLTLIGIGANPSSPTVWDEITLGNIYVNKLRCNATTITSLSDRRDKKNIKDLSLGLDFLMKLKPREFNWDKRDWYEDKISDGSKMQETPTAGFIAQELDSIQISENVEWLDLVLKSNPEKWEATPGNLFPIVVKAIQELKTENDELKSELDDLKSIKEQLAEIQGLKEELIKQINILRDSSRENEVNFSSIENQGE